MFEPDDAVAMSGFLIVLFWFWWRNIERPRDANQAKYFAYSHQLFVQGKTIKNKAELQGDRNTVFEVLVVLHRASFFSPLPANRVMMD